MKKYLLALAALVAIFPVNAGASCVEVNMSTCVGDFANGGDLEAGNRLLGNASSYSFGILQDNKVRIFISSGHFWNTSSTPATAGNVGIATDWNPTTMGNPLYTLDVRGMIRTTTGYTFPDGSVQTTAAGGSSAGGTRAYQIIVGTLGAIGVDYASNSVVQVTNQIYSDKGASNSSTNTVPITIFFRPGVYGGAQSSCAANSYWFTVPLPSGTIFVMENDSQPITTNFGTQDGFTYDAGSRPFSGDMINMRNRSKLKNFTIIGAQAMTNYSQAAVINMESSSNCVVSDGWFKEWHGCAGRTWQGNCAAIRNYTSTDTYTSRVLFSTPMYLGSMYETAWATVRTRNAHMSDCIFEGVNAIVLSIGTGLNTFIERNKFNIGAGSQGDGANYGLITLDGSDEAPNVGASSTTLIADNNFVFISTGGAPGNIIRSRSYGGGIGNGYLIKNNTVSSQIRTNWTFYKQIGGTVYNVVLKNNDVYNLENLIVDSGIGTAYQSLGNMLNGKEQ